MPADIRSESIALAALFQACGQIQKVARTGAGDPQACAVLIRALIITDPGEVDDIYRPDALAPGFRQLVSSLTTAIEDRNTHTVEITKTAFKLITLEQAIERNQAVFDRLGHSIDQLRISVLSECPDYENAAADVILTPGFIREYAKLYQSLISPNFPNLIIYGEEAYLRIQDNQDQIRALLLAAIRAIVLWRQVGGRRRYFIFRRGKILEFSRRYV